MNKLLFFSLLLSICSTMQSGEKKLLINVANYDKECDELNDLIANGHIIEGTSGIDIKRILSQEDKRNRLLSAASLAIQQPPATTRTNITEITLGLLLEIVSIGSAVLPAVNTSAQSLTDKLLYAGLTVTSAHGGAFLIYDVLSGGPGKRLQSRIKNNLDFLHSQISEIAGQDQTPRGNYEPNGSDDDLQAP